jgi:Na+/melibiose symporter-like transporter
MAESKQVRRLRLSQHLGYAGGDVANNLTFCWRRCSCCCTTPTSSVSPPGPRPQSPGALDAIRYLTGFGPALFVGIGAAIMLAYPLTEERFGEVVGEIAVRRAERERTRDQVPQPDA